MPLCLAPVLDFQPFHPPEDTIMGNYTAWAAGQEVLGHIDGLHQLEEVLPGFRPPRQDDVTRGWVAADIDLRALEAVVGGQADGLAAPIVEKLCPTRHG